jgi:HPt (histidine-containing phosphotransfer) domain-containing protein
MSDEQATNPIAHVDATLEGLIPRYLHRRREDAEALERAVSDADWECVAHLGHMMKGSGGGYGFDPVTELGGLIERAGQDRDGEAVLEAASTLRHYVDKVEIIFVDPE